MESRNPKAGAPGSKNVFQNCYDTWSRCSEWSSAGTGILWKTCDGICKEKGKSGGHCEIRPSTCPVTDKANTCVCDK
ncbi:hypothetical protein BsWGS_21891 [Bradybaena similaris]